MSSTSLITHHLLAAAAASQDPTDRKPQGRPTARLVEYGAAAALALEVLETAGQIPDGARRALRGSIGVRRT